MPDDHSELVPPLPIPNRTVKRLHANDSADTRVKVGNRQAPHCCKSNQKPHPKGGVFAFQAPVLDASHEKQRPRAPPKSSVVVTWRPPLDNLHLARRKRPSNAMLDANRA